MSNNIELVPRIIDGIKQAQASNKKPAFAYVRVSSDKQEDGNSLEYQEKKAKEYSERAGLYLIHIFSVIESAKRENRIVFNTMLNLCDKLGMKHLVFKSLDRMTRNLIDFARIEKKIIGNELVIHLFQDGRIYNEDITHNEKFELGIQALLGKFWSDKISYDVKKGNLFKAQNGIAPCRSPYGYIYDLENKEHLIDKKVEADIRFIFDEFDTGKYSIDDFIMILNQKGIKTISRRDWTKGNLHRFLTNPFYHGDFYYNGKIWPRASMKGIMM